MFIGPRREVGTEVKGGRGGKAFSRVLQVPDLPGRVGIRAEGRLYPNGGREGGSSAFREGSEEDESERSLF